MNQEKIEKIFELLYDKTDNPNIELNYTNNFTLLVAIVLSAQSTDVIVNRATKDLFVKYDTPQKMLDAGIDVLKEHIKIIGLYNTKAQNIMKLCKILIEEYNSIVPDTFEELIKLPGVGHKTANVMLNSAYNKATIGVDTHVFRVSRRLGFSNSNNHEKLGLELMKIIPQKWLPFANHLLVLHGRYTCKAKKPNCKNCSIESYCKYINKDLL